MAKAAGTLAGVPTIRLDLGSMRGGIVGTSEQNLRQALKVITAVSGGQTLWLATSNNIAQIPSELKRRFKRGTWFFDLPSQEERLAIWKLYFEKYQLAEPLDNLPDDKDWTGAEIAQCAELAWDLQLPLSRAAARIVPVAVSAREQIERLRTEASGRYLCATRGGVYRAQAVTQTRGRRARLEEE
jgi:SpoVK/Ycf46/Vps4 family AAA+-type ATPase